MALLSQILFPESCAVAVSAARLSFQPAAHTGHHLPVHSSISSSIEVRRVCRRRRPSTTGTRRYPWPCQDAAALLPRRTRDMSCVLTGDGTKLRETPASKVLTTRRSTTPAPTEPLRAFAFTNNDAAGDGGKVSRKQNCERGFQRREESVAAEVREWAAGGSKRREGVQYTDVPLVAYNEVGAEGGGVGSWRRLMRAHSQQQPAQRHQTAHLLVGNVGGSCIRRRTSLSMSRSAGDVEGDGEGYPPLQRQAGAIDSGEERVELAEKNKGRTEAGVEDSLTFAAQDAEQAPPLPLETAAAKTVRGHQEAGSKSPSADARTGQRMISHARDAGEAGCKPVINFQSPEAMAGHSEPFGVEAKDLVAESYERGKWLLGLLILQSTSSSVLDKYQDLLRQHVVVTLFLTMLVGAGGNAGNQSAIKVIRGLATGNFTADAACALKVVGDQAVVGFLLGTVMAAGGFVRVWITEGTTLRDASAISASLFLIVMVSVLLGAALPFGFAKAGVDPAHAGTTIQVAMDIVGVAATCVTCSFILTQLEQALPFSL